MTDQSTTVEAVLEDVAHGGWVVARLAGKATFCSGGLPGERVRIEITEVGKRFDRGRVVEVLEPHPSRVLSPCPVADRCGGCDWQHASADFQRELKRRVVAEQLRRLAGIDWDGKVQAVEPVSRWRTRMRYLVRDGVIALRGRRSHEAVPVPDQGCQIAAGPVPSPAEGADEMSVVDSDSGRSVLADGMICQGEALVSEHCRGRSYLVSASGFWQVHPRAAETLTDAVLRALKPKPKEVALDLYCGVGLFAGALIDAGARVLGVELNRRAVELARKNVPKARFEVSRIERFVGRAKSADLVVLDPPRTGAGRNVVEGICALRPRAIAYVSCDPATLARDLAVFQQLDYRVDSVEAFDLFPATHHVECVAKLSLTCGCTE